VTTEDAASVPASPPSSWLLAEASSHAVRFVESAFSGGDCSALVRKTIPGARDISVTAMSLREIFIVLARRFRFSDSQGGAR
jgi:hypothetical protein